MSPHVKHSHSQNSPRESPRLKIQQGNRPLRQYLQEYLKLLVCRRQDLSYACLHEFLEGLNEPSRTFVNWRLARLNFLDLIVLVNGQDECHPDDHLLTEQVSPPRSRRSNRNTPPKKPRVPITYEQVPTTASRQSPPSAPSSQDSQSSQSSPRQWISPPDTWPPKAQQASESHGGAHVFLTRESFSYTQP